MTKEGPIEAGVMIGHPVRCTRSPVQTAVGRLRSRSNLMVHGQSTVRTATGNAGREDSEQWNPVGA